MVSTMKVGQLFSPHRIKLGLRATDKDRVLEKLAAWAAEEAGVAPLDLLNALRRREALGSTGTGNGVALPHCRVPGSLRPLAWLARLAQPVHFEAVDEKPVDIVALIVSGGSAEGEALNALACAARLVRSEVSLLRSVGSSEQAYAAISQASFAPSEKKEP
jgi:PTS system nitrogen regulatory IIA component